MSASIALVGDYNKSVIAHDAIPRALEHLSSDFDINWSWVSTASLQSDAKNLASFSAIWLVPGSPYINMDGALSAIRFARELGRPFVGTCGGFQHALIEYARNVCGVYDADHAETAKNNTHVVTPLLCSLVGRAGHISFTLGSQLNSIFNGQETKEDYHCNYGLNPEWKIQLETAGLHFTGFDTEDQVRAFELPMHPFFIGTLFQPELSALRGEKHPLIRAFVKATLDSKRKLK